MKFLKINKTYLGDYLDFIPQIKPASVDMIMCDLPYGTTANAWDGLIPFEWLWKEYTRVIKGNGAIVLTASQPFTSALVMSNLEMFKTEWICELSHGSNYGHVKHLPLKQHLSVLVFGKGGYTPYYPIMQQKSPNSLRTLKYDMGSSQVGHNESNLHERHYSEEQRISTNRYPSSVQKFTRQTGLHPNQKPVKMFEYFIKTYSKKGDTVLDNCAGSGTTLVACYNTGRNFIQIEKEEEYYNVILEREVKIKNDMFTKQNL